MEKNFGIRFTEESYATKDDVKKALNISSIDSIWDKVTQYRAYYTRQIDLKNIERVPFSIVLPNKFTSKIINLEKKLSKLMVKYSIESIKNLENINQIKHQVYLNILNQVSKNYQLDVSQETLDGIIFNSLPTLPVEYLFLNRYYQTLKFIESRHNGPLNKFVIASLYTKIRGIDLDIENLDIYYRKNDLLDKNDHVFVGKHYEAAPLDRINDMMVSLCDFLNNSTLFSFVKASIAYFYINYIKPYDYYNEEMALLVFKYVIANEEFDDIGSLIPLELVLSKDFEDEIAYLSRESELKLDLTYISKYLVDFSLIKVNELSSLFENLNYQQIIQENYQPPVEKVKKFEETQTSIIQEERKEIEGVTFKQNVSIPTLPTGLDEKDANMVAKNLIEIYPSMKKAQAEFYSRHCTIGKYYTISQYKKEQNVAYETARTSMDNLTNMGFYKKEQIKNKFVYTPVAR